VVEYTVVVHSDSDVSHDVYDDMHSEFDVHSSEVLIHSVVEVHSSEELMHSVVELHSTEELMHSVELVGHSDGVV
jgi:ribosomal protein L20A (L18A)